MAGCVVVGDIKHQLRLNGVLLCCKYINEFVRKHMSNKAKRVIMYVLSRQHAAGHRKIAFQSSDFPYSSYYCYTFLSRPSFTFVRSKRTSLIYIEQDWNFFTGKKIEKKSEREKYSENFRIDQRKSFLTIQFDVAFLNCSNCR